MNEQDVLATVGAPEGGVLLKWKHELEPDGSAFIVALVDYGIGGVKKFREPKPDDAGETAEQAPPEGAKPKPTKAAGKR
jgi:hypothetical protein